MMPRLAPTLSASLLMTAALIGRAEERPNLSQAARHVRTVVGHRGSCGDRPENTLASYRRAIEAGATAVEIDVRTTKDGVLVSRHDDDVRRTTDGQGKVSELTLAELKRLDAGGWFDAKYRGERIPTVREILELCRGKVAVLFDLKETGEEYARRVTAEVRGHADPKQVVFGVRSAEQARLFRRLLPESRQLGLIPKTTDVDAFAAAGVEAIRLWPHWLGDAALVARVRHHKLQLHLNAAQGTKEEVLALLVHGPESLSSDDPARLVQTLAGLAGDKGAAPAGSVETGQRVFSAGHSFHVFVPALLQEMARAAGLKDHTQVGVSSIGGSRVIQHWNQPDDKNKVKPALSTGKVDVLTLSPIYLPDEGIELLAKLALEHNPNVRVTVQEFWLPYDVYQPDYQKKRPAPADRNARTAQELRAISAPYFQSMDDHVRALNKQFGKPVVSVVPVGQAVIALREKIIEGKAPGLKTQDELFTDAIGHVKAPVQVLTAYCHFAVIYRRSPVGLPVPTALERAKNPGWDDKLNRLLQELAWEAVVSHPLSGVTRDTPTPRTQAPAARPWLPATAYVIPKETAPEGEGYFSIIEGHNRRLYIGTHANAVNSWLVEFDPATKQMKIVVDVHKAIGTDARGFAAQAKIHTRNNVGASGKIYFGTKQGYPAKDEKRTDYPGGYPMVYDPATGQTKVYPIPVPHHGINSITPDEARGVAYVSTCSDERPIESAHFLILDLKTGMYRDLIDTRHVYGFIVVDYLGRAYHPLLGGDIARYDPRTDKLERLKQTIEGQPPTPESLLAQPNSHPVNWDISPDGKTLYAVAMSGNQLYGYDLSGSGDTLAGRRLGDLIPGAKKTDCRALCVGPTGEVWAAVTEAEGALRLLHLVRYRSGEPTPRDLGRVAVSNPDYTEFTDKSGKPLPAHHGLHKMPDGTVTTKHVILGVCQARDGAVYALALSPYTLLQVRPPQE